jgi:hypothetical protein
MNLKSAKSRLVAVGITIVCLYAFNLSGRPVKTAVQSEYESWLEKTDKVLRDKETSEMDLPTITVQVSFPEEGVTDENWKLTAENQPQNRDRILRILHLVEESDLLAISNPRADSSRSPKISINIKDSSSEFESVFNEADIAANLKVHLLLRLFKEFAVENQNMLTNKGAADSEDKNNDNS